MHCNITQATTVKDWAWVLRHTTPLTHTNFFLIVRGCLVRAPKQPPPESCWLCHHYQRSLFFSFLYQNYEFENKGYQSDWHIQLIELDIQKLSTANQLTALSHNSLLPIGGCDIYIYSIFQSLQI
jgi:hypothetical protein